MKKFFSVLLKIEKIFILSLINIKKYKIFKGGVVLLLLFSLFFSSCELFTNSLKEWMDEHTKNGTPTIIWTKDYPIDDEGRRCFPSDIAEAWLTFDSDLYVAVPKADYDWHAEISLPASLAETATKAGITDLSKHFTASVNSNLKLTVGISKELIEKFDELGGDKRDLTVQVLVVDRKSGQTFNAGKPYTFGMAANSQAKIAGAKAYIDASGGGSGKYVLEVSVDKVDGVHQDVNSLTVEHGGQKHTLFFAENSGSGNNRKTYFYDNINKQIGNYTFSTNKGSIVEIDANAPTQYPAAILTEGTVDTSKKTYYITTDIAPKVGTIDEFKITVGDDGRLSSPEVVLKPTTTTAGGSAKISVTANGQPVDVGAGTTQANPQYIAGSATSQTGTIKFGNLPNDGTTTIYSIYNVTENNYVAKDKTASTNSSENIDVNKTYRVDLQYSKPGQGTSAVTSYYFMIVTTAEYFVNASGNDSNLGETAANAVQTIGKAVELAKNAGYSNVKIYLLGDYSNPFEINGDGAVTSVIIQGSDDNKQATNRNITGSMTIKSSGTTVKIENITQSGSVTLEGNNAKIELGGTANIGGTVREPTSTNNVDMSNFTVTEGFNATYANSTLTLAHNNSSSPVVTVSKTATVTNVKLSGNVTVNNGVTLTLSGAGSSVTGNVTANGALSMIDSLVNGTVTSSGTVTMNGNASIGNGVTLSGNGASITFNGTSKVGNSISLQGSTASISATELGATTAGGLAAGTKITATTNSLSIDKPITVSSGMMTLNNVSVTGGALINNSATLEIEGTTTFTGIIQNANNTASIYTASGGSTSGVPSGVFASGTTITGGSSLTVSGNMTVPSGTLTLNNVTANGDKTTINNSATLQVQGSTSFRGSIVNQSSSALIENTAGAITSGVFASGTTITGAASNLTVSNGITVSSNAVALKLKNVTTNGNITYNQGTLTLEGSVNTGSNTLTIGSGGTVDISGMTGGSVKVSATVGEVFATGATTAAQAGYFTTSTNGYTVYRQTSSNSLILVNLSNINISSSSALTLADAVAAIKAAPSTTTTATINVSGNVALNQKLTLDVAGKTINITGGGTIQRGNGLTADYLVNATSGNINLENITIDGNNITSTKSLVGIEGAEVTMKSGSITNGKFDNGSASASGGGVIINSGKFIMQGGSISSNEVKGGGAGSFGGGVAVSGGIFEMTGGSISGNKAGIYGGGVHVGSTGEFNMSGGSITGNQSTSQKTGGREGGGISVFGKLNIQGNINITGNTNSANDADNLCTMNSVVFNITGNLSASSSIGISKLSGIITSGWTTSGNTNTNIFTSDLGKTISVNSNGELVVQ